MSASIPPEIPGYEIVRELNRGGMAIVYLARQVTLDREVALKVMSDRLTDRVFKDRFLREARIVASMNHPHIVTIYDVGEHDGHMYLSMELLTGGDLGDRLARGPMPTGDSLDVLASLVGAISFAHQKSVVHRDIKPENIMFSSTGQMVLTDFGIAKALDGNADNLTQEGAAIGTPAYMSPEQFEGDIDFRTDYYSVGVVFYQMLAGERPYQANSLPAFMFKHHSEPVPELPETLKEFQPLVSGLMAKDRDGRWSSPEKILGFLAERETLTRRGEEATVVTEAPVAAGQTGAGPAADITAAPQSDGRGNHLFISYARADSEQVYPEIEKLQSWGLPVWFDRGIRPGREWTEEIAAAIEHSTHLVFFVTPRSAASRNCRDELTFAQSKGIPVVAVHLEPTELTGGLQLSLGLSQAILKYQRSDAEYEEMVLAAIDAESVPPMSPTTTATHAGRSHVSWPKFAIVGGFLVAILGAGVYLLDDEPSSPVPEAVSGQAEGAQVERTTPPPPVEIAPASVAVLPFDDFSQEQNQQFFADGLADTLTQVLGGVDDLKVAARAAAFSYRKTEAPLKEIAEALLVAHILNGSVQTSGDRVRVFAELVLARTGEQVWSSTFNGRRDDIFAIQDSIASEVLEALESVLFGDAGLREQYRPDLDAYEQLLLGRREMNTRDADSLKAAEMHFKRAIELDPDYALAYIALADAYSLQDVFLYGYQDSYSGIPSAASRDLQQPLIDKALALAPQSGEAHASQARIIVDESQAEREFQRAIELAPNYAPAYLWYGEFLSLRQGRYEDAHAILEQARALDPVSDPIKYAWIRSLWSIGRTDEAIRQLTAAVQSNLDFPPYYKIMARWQAKRGRAGNALRWIRRLREIDPDNPSHWGEFAGECFMLGSIGRHEEAAACNQAFITTHPESIVARRDRARQTGGQQAVINVFRTSYASEPGNDYRVNQMGFELISIGRFEEAIDILRQGHPELFEPEPVVTGHSIWPALDLAMAYRELGRETDLERILTGIEQAIGKMKLIEGPGYTWGIENVYVASLRGNEERAIDLLEQQFNRGWRFGAHWLAVLPQLVTLRDDPRFQRLLERAGAYAREQDEWYEAHKDEPLF